MIPFLTTSQNKYVATINQPDPVQAPEINTVTVSSENKNIVEWKQKPDPNILYLNIYRDTPEAVDKWTKVGHIVYPGTNSFSDASSFPSMRSYQYRISTMDKCGNEHFNSRIHKTIKLDLTEINDSNYVLSWNPYEGFETTGYKIYSGENATDLMLIDSTLAMFSKYTVKRIKDKEIFYQIEATGKAYTSLVKDNQFSLRRIARSNICSNKSVFSHPTEAPQLQVYPNPMSTHTIVMFPYYPGEDYYLSIIDLTGNTVYSTPVYSGQIEIERKNLKEGMYILQIAGSKKHRKKLIIGRM